MLKFVEASVNLFNVFCAVLAMLIAFVQLIVTTLIGLFIFAVITCVIVGIIALIIAGITSFSFLII
jgi:hypothetical protein